MVTAGGECLKCKGLMVRDLDRESITGVRCVNCGGDGGERRQIQVIEAEEEELEGCTRYSSKKNDRCGEPRASGSKYCVPHRDQNRKANARAKPAASSPAKPAGPEPIIYGQGKRIDGRSRKRGPRHSFN